MLQEGLSEEEKFFQAKLAAKKIEPTPQKAKNPFKLIDSINAKIEILKNISHWCRIFIRSCIIIYSRFIYFCSYALQYAESMYFELPSSSSLPQSAFARLLTSSPSGTSPLLSFLSSPDLFVIPKGQGKILLLHLIWTLKTQNFH